MERLSTAFFPCEYSFVKFLISNTACIVYPPRYFILRQIAQYRIAGTGTKSSRQYLLATLLAPFTPKCSGIVSGRKKSAASTPNSVTTVRIIIMLFCFLLIEKLLSGFVFEYSAMHLFSHE